MKIQILGCGNAFSTINYNQCFMLTESFQKNERKMLIDFGAKAPYALHKARIDINKIDDIYISHLHGDHVGGLEEMAFLRYDWVNRPEHFSDGCYAPTLIGNDMLLKDLWDKTLRGGLESMEGFDANLETYFEPFLVKPNTIFDWQGWNCSLIQQIHIMSGSTISPTYGLFMEKYRHDSIYFTTDTQHCSPKQVETFYKKADLIFQDCECVGIFPEERRVDFSSGVHATYAQLAGWDSANSTKLSDDIKSKMLLSHYQDFVTKGKDYLGNKYDWFFHTIEDGFKGFVKVGDIYEV